MHEVTKLVAQSLKLVRSYLDKNEAGNEDLLLIAAENLQTALDKLCEDTK